MSRLLVYGGNFEKFNELLSSVVQPGRYTVEQVTNDQLTLENLRNNCAALFLSDLDDSTGRDVVAKFVFTGSSPGRAMLFCNVSSDESFWLLRAGFKENRSVPDVIDLFRKFARKEDIPINRQAVQLTGVDADDEFTVALARVENSVEYLCASGESGSTAVFVAAPLEDALRHTKAVWSDLAAALNLDTVAVDPQVHHEDPESPCIVKYVVFTTKKTHSAE